MIPRHHPLASVRGAYNAVFVESESAGQLMFYGPGAGGAPTASAVLGDVVTSPATASTSVFGPGESHPRAAWRCSTSAGPAPATTSPIDVDDRPASLSSVAHAFAEHDVSITTVRQEGRGDDAQLVVVTHEADDAALSRRPSGSCATSTMVRDVSSVMRVEGGLYPLMATPVARRDRGVPRPAPASVGDTPVVSLGEGGTPLVHSAWLSGSSAATYASRSRASNPTGSFKDRGMTTAISVAVAEGAKAVVCASTGNTSASMTAYAARAGLHADRARAAGQDRGRQDGAGRHARLATSSRSAATSTTA